MVMDESLAGGSNPHGGIAARDSKSQASSCSASRGRFMVLGWGVGVHSPELGTDALSFGGPDRLSLSLFLRPFPANKKTECRHLFMVEPTLRSLLFAGARPRSGPYYMSVPSMSIIHSNEWREP